MARHASILETVGRTPVVVMAESFSVERRRLIRFLGARVILTPAALRATGMVRKAVELAERHGWFYARQFENPANPDMHERTTAREIIEDFRDERLDYFVTGYGTGGTLNGVARVLARESPATRVVVCEPADAPLLGSGAPQARNPDGSASAGHPAWKPHPMQGWTPDFIPKITGDIDLGRVHRVLPVTGPDAMRCCRELAAREGIFVGITSGATFAAALVVAREAAPGSSILCMLPDTGERYLSTPLFAEVPADMTAEEQEIFRSTPYGQKAA
jgi:cysteine synthase A